MKTFLKGLTGTVLYLISLFLFFIAPTIVGIITNQEAYSFISPLLVSLYMAMVTVTAKKFWHKLLYNSIFAIGSLGTGIVTCNYVLPRYFPDLFNFAVANPNTLVEIVSNYLVLYMASNVLFIIVYHEGRKMEREENQNIAAR